MAGTGTVNYVCEQMGRVGYGVELEDCFYEIAKNRSNQVMIHGDCRDLGRFNVPEADFIITSPPYWNSLKKSHKRQKVRKARNLMTDYGMNEANFGNIVEYQDFLARLIEFYRSLQNRLNPGKYMVVVANNVYKEGRVYPLAFDLASRLSMYYNLKDEQVWCQDNKRLMVLGINVTYVGNRHHSYCLIFQNSRVY
jgi:tRNA G10  N-methylase Trm11